MNERRRWTDLVGTMSVELMKPFSLTYVRYPGDDPLGAAMALASLMPFCVIVATFGAFFARRELWDVGTLLGILANEVLAQTLKRVFQQPRPASCALVDFCGTHGMPSSHAQLAWFVAAVAVLAYRRRRDAHPASTRVVDAFGALLVAAHVPMAIAVTASRVYLGYHSAEQVAAGAMVGAAARDGGIGTNKSKTEVFVCPPAPFAAEVARTVRTKRTRDATKERDSIRIERG